MSDEVKRRPQFRNVSFHFSGSDLECERGAWLARGVGGCVCACAYICVCGRARLFVYVMYMLYACVKQMKIER